MNHYAIIRQPDHSASIPIWENPDAEHVASLAEVHSLVNMICGRNPLTVASVARLLQRKGSVYIAGRGHHPGVRIARVP
jgi:hypothetical protein